MALSWVSVNANDGTIITDLTTLGAGGPLKQTMMRFETIWASLPMDEAPSNWVQATRKGAAFLVALDENRVPMWGGLVTRRLRAVGGGVTMSLVTAEEYFDRVFVGDETFTATPQNTLVKTLVEKYAKNGAKNGLPIRVQVVGGNGMARDRTYLDADDKTLYSILSDLSGVIGGPEWTVGWEWVTSSQLGLVVYVGDRLGAPAPTGLNPGAQFILGPDGGCISDAELVEGFGAGEGANDVMAVSSGAGAARPQSPHQTNTGDLRPRFEYRWSPSTSITNVDTLTAHAQRALKAMKDGSLALTITANRQEAPKLGKDWFIGDDIGFDITAQEFPGGLYGTARCVGWEMTDTTITPLLDVTGITGIDGTGNPDPTVGKALVPFTPSATLTPQPTLTLAGG